MQITRTITNCPKPEELIEAQAEDGRVTLTLTEGGPLTISIVGHSETGDGVYEFTGHVDDTGTKFELICWDYGSGVDGTLVFDDDLPDPHLELAEANPGL